MLSSSLEARADDALAAAVLRLERIDGQTADVAFAAERDDLFLFGDEVFGVEIVHGVFDRRAACVAVLVGDFIRALEHDRYLTFAVSEDVFQVRNRLEEFRYSFSIFPYPRCES